MVTICLTCGCRSPLDRHGAKENIDYARLAKAAGHVGISVLQAARNIRDSLPVPGPLPHLYVDVDGVLAFQPEGTIIAVNAKFGTDYLVPEATGYPFSAQLPDRQARWERASQAVIGANLAPDTLAISVLCQAVSHGYPLTVCTERAPSLAPVTRAWCAFWGVPADQVAVVGPGGKEPLLEAHGEDGPAILIDDSPLNTGLARPGVQVWQPARPYNCGGDGVFRFGSWDEAALRLGLA